MDEQLQQQIQELVALAMNGDQQAQQQIQQIMQAAQQGNQQAQQIAMIIQEELQNAQGISQAKNGAKLEYINYLRGKCPEGYEIGYFKKGGNLCKACVKKKQQMKQGAQIPEPTNAVEAFKCGRSMNKKKKCETGAPIEMDKCGGKSKKRKACGGSKLPFKANGGSLIPFMNRVLK